MNTSSHFFALSSRLGMHHLPWKGNEPNVGVEDGPKAILTPEFLHRFPDALLDSYSYSLVDEVDPNLIFSTIAKQSKVFASYIEWALRLGEVPVVVGGDHSVSLAPFSAVLNLYDPSSVCVIRIDSHPDILTSHTSSTGNVHGMWMRPFLSTFDEPELDQLVGGKRLNPSHVLYIGNLDCEDEERRFIDQNEMFVYNRHDLSDETCKTQILNWARGFKHVILDIDIDAFDESIAPATGIPSSDGLLLEDVSFLFGSLENLVSLHLVEVNPEKDNGQTVALAQKIIQMCIAPHME